MASACTVLVVEGEPMIRSYRGRGNCHHRGLFRNHGGVADIQMPGTMDGIALARYVRKRWPPTIIVVSSGRGQPTAGVLAEEIPFLAKPYDDQRLSEIIGRVRERLAAT